METTTVSGLRVHYAWIVLAAGTLAVFGALGLARFGYSLVLPAMQAGLALSNTQTGLMVTTNLAGYLVMSVAGGALAARFGPRAVVSLSLLLAGVGMLITGLAGSFQAASLAGLLVGLGSGGGNVPVMALLTAWFARKQRGLAAGIAVGGSSLGLIVVGPLTPRILALYGEAGWRTSWFLFGAVTLGLAILSAAALRNRPAELGLRPVGAEAGTPAASPATGGLAWGRVYRSALVWRLGLVYFAFGFAYIVYTTFFSKYLIAEGGYTREEAGALLMVIGGCSLASGLIWGLVSDRIGRQGALMLVYALHAAAYALFGLWPAPVGFSLSAVLFGLVAWSIPAIMSAACGDLLGPRLAPAALGFLTLFFGVGQALGPGVAGAVADAAGSFAPAFLLAAALSGLGAIGAAWLRPQAVTVSP